jgi:hypothetical protein
MNDYKQFEGAPDPRGDYAKLARWLQQVLQAPPEVEANTPGPAENDAQLELLLTHNYHLKFYQQLPDFIMALLTNDAKAMLLYTPLLYHLAACPECHSAYLDLYDSMRAALYPRGARPLLGQGTRTLAATPQRMLGHLCQALISQAEAVLRQARRDHSDGDAAARSLLQLALSISSHISQSGIRRQALDDLVRVATLSEGTSDPDAEDPAVRAYAPTFAGAGGMRGKKIIRRAEAPQRPGAQDQAAIHLQSRTLEGTIRQRGRTLELHLQDLDQGLRGRYVNIAVPLGSLIEPVQWAGGNPRSIRSSTPVDATGTLITPLGETDLQLSNPEERNLLEAMFMLLEVRAADNAA